MEELPVPEKPQPDLKEVAVALVSAARVPRTAADVPAALEQARQLGIVARRLKERLTAECEQYLSKVRQLEEQYEPYIEAALESRKLLEQESVAVCRQEGAGIPRVMPMRVDMVPVVDDEAALPRAYLMPNMKAIREAVREGRVIPGVRFEERITFIAKEDKDD